MESNARLPGASMVPEPAAPPAPTEVTHKPAGDGYIGSTIYTVVNAGEHHMHLHQFQACRSWNSVFLGIVAKACGFSRAPASLFPALPATA